MINEDCSISVNKPGILVSGSDPDGDKLEARLVEGPKHGKLKLVEDGSFKYKPEKNYDGMDGFEYEACDGSGTCSRKATITTSRRTVYPALISVSPLRIIPLTIAIILSKR